MHALDPAGTRELVKQALEGGSKEVKVAAIACLGAEPEDLRVPDRAGGGEGPGGARGGVRGLAAIDDPAAVAVLEKAFAGKDVDCAAEPSRQSRSDHPV